MKKASRMENSKDARRVLNRNGVDLSYCQYNVAGSEVRLTGYLCKVDGSEYNGLQVEGIIHDFQRTLKDFTVVGDLDNWKFSSDHISFLGDRKEHQENMSQEQADIEKEYDDYDIVG
jgi:hypothetical protein